MIGSFESMVRLYPQRTCFTYVDEAGDETPYSYRETRMLAAALSRYLQTKGVHRGDYVAVDLPNCPLYILLILAAAYGNFALVAINNRLTDSEKISRVLELERCLHARIAFRVDGARAASLFDGALAMLAGESSTADADQAVRPSFMARSKVATTQARSARGLGRAQNGRDARRRRDETHRQDAFEEILHHAERSAHVFDSKARALVMFTSGTTGKPKAVPLTWNQLCDSAQASNAMLNRTGEGLWQAALPLYHVGGFQILVRSIMGCVPFILYEHFDAKRVLHDAAQARATHISVVDKMLQDLLDCDSNGTLSAYRCILLGGGAANPQTLARALAADARVYASYGMTETSSQIAHAQVTPSFDGGLRLLPGYVARIVDPDSQGFGRLAVKGPGVFAGYLNARAAHTVDGFFLTGDTAAMLAGRLYVKERTSDMFVSGGENIYPAEIREKLMRVPGVSDAHVFGVSDEKWGRRPVAFVERAVKQKPERKETRAGFSPNANGSAGAGVAPRFGRADAVAPVAPPVSESKQTPQQFAASVQDSLSTRVSKLYWPRHVCVLDEFPRTGIGKVDRAAIEAAYERRIEIARVTLHRIRLPFSKPFRTAKGVMNDRESVIVEVQDHAGRTGLGECVAFSTDWYLPETLEQDVRFIRDVLAPRVLEEVYLHPSEVSPSLASCADVAQFPLAQGALEPALWDLYGKIVQKPLSQLIGGAASSETVPAGAVVGMASAEETVAAVARCVEAGYRRVKMKVAPGRSLAAVQAVRAAYPNLMITLDANQSFTERDMDELRALDACNIAWIEEPLDPRRLPTVGPTDIFARLARLQRSLRTPVCVDESVARPQDLARALRQSDLRCYALKIAKFGGVQPALDFVKLAQSRRISVWMGGMYDTGVSKRLHAAFETLPGINAPGDVGATARYFDCDVTEPPYTVERGMVTLNRARHPYGLGCELNRPALDSVLIDRVVITR